MRKKINLYFLSGFLGAGKTTIFNKLLDKLKDQKVAVIINEFGKVSLDGDYIKHQSDGLEITELSDGLVFCACQSKNFVKALVEMSKNDYDYVIVETSGLADPSNALDIIASVEQDASDIYNFLGVVTVVDGLNFLKNVEEQIQVLVRQIKHANIVIISKTDLIGAAELAEITEQIRRINDFVPIITSSNGELSRDFFHEDLYEYGRVASEATTNTSKTKPRTFLLTFKGEVDKAKFLQFIDEIKDQAFRIKGLFDTEDDMYKLDVVGNQVDVVASDSSSLYDNNIVIMSKTGNDIIRPIFDAWHKHLDVEMKLR